MTPKQRRKLIGFIAAAVISVTIITAILSAGRHNADRVRAAGAAKEAAARGEVPGVLYFKDFGDGKQGAAAPSPAAHP